MRRALALATALVVLGQSVVAFAGDIVDNDANALILANRAKQLSGSRHSDDADRQQRRLSLRGSAIANIASEASCGGVAIGNVRPVVGDHRQHQTVVIIQGNVVNTHNDC